ncbi:hypothetical protein EMIT0P260_70138 [Pseudomonas sp. IT-P260]
MILFLKKQSQKIAAFGSSYRELRCGLDIGPRMEPLRSHFAHKWYAASLANPRPPSCH